MDGGDTTQTVKDNSGDIAGGGETTLSYMFKSASIPPSDYSSPSFPSRLRTVLQLAWDCMLMHFPVLRSLEADHTVHLIRGSAATTSASATNVVNPNANQDAPRVAVPTTGGLFVRVGGGPLFSELGSRGGLFGAGLPDFEQDLVNDPEIICNFIVNSPQMREYVNLNPELPHIFNDPAIFLQIWEAARNELMHETIRTIQWSLSHTESSPDEFNMLRHMYENVEEPFLNATSMAEQGRNRSTNPPATGSDTTANPPGPDPNPVSDPWASADFGGAQMNTAPRSNASRNIWGPSLGGLDDIADLQRMLGGIPGATSEN
nr:ubiquitin domain-containing protein DSK2b-like [Solanum lycopersicum]